MIYKVVRNNGDLVCYGPNEDYYQPKLKDGDSISIEETEPTFTTKYSAVSAWAIRRALTQMGLRDAVEQAVAGADQDTKDMWEYATTYHRISQFTLAIAAALNKTDSDLDQLFTIANQIEDENNGY